MNIFKGSYKYLARECSKLRSKEIRKNSPYLRKKAIKIFSSNPRINGRWKVRRIVCNLKRVKRLIIKEQDTQTNILLLKAYSNLVTPLTKSYYTQRRRSIKSKLPFETLCFVCKKEEAYCNHHIQLLINGGSNEDYNLIPICKSCHKKIHDWIN